MPRTEIPLEPIAEGQAELAREVGQLEADGKRILDIQYPGWAAEDLGIVSDPKRGNRETYGSHCATQYAQVTAAEPRSSSIRLISPLELAALPTQHHHLDLLGSQLPWKPGGI